MAPAGQLLWRKRCLECESVEGFSQTVVRKEGEDAPPFNGLEFRLHSSYFDKFCMIGLLESCEFFFRSLGIIV